MIEDRRRRQRLLVGAGLVVWALLLALLVVDPTGLREDWTVVPVLGVTTLGAIPLSLGGFLVAQGLGTPTRERSDSRPLGRRLERGCYWLASACYGLHVATAALFFVTAVFLPLAVVLALFVSMGSHIASAGTYLLAAGLLVRVGAAGARRALPDVAVDATRRRK